MVKVLIDLLDRLTVGRAVGACTSAAPWSARARVSVNQRKTAPSGRSPGGTSLEPVLPTTGPLNHGRSPSHCWLSSTPSLTMCAVAWCAASRSLWRSTA